MEELEGEELQGEKEELEEVIHAKIHVTVNRLDPAIEQ